MTRNPNQTLWEAILPPGFERLPKELEAVDALLDDEAFFAPYRPHFSALFGRPSTPIETYLRMMFLKFRYRLGYESLCREVADSISWSRFCRIPLGSSVPHPSTLEKITTRCGEEAVRALNEALLGKAKEAKVLRTNELRADSTVVPANVAYPTDSGLLVKAIGRLTTLVSRIHGLGAARRTKLRDRRRGAGRRARSISAHLKLRNDEAKAAVSRITTELCGIAEASIAEASAVLRNAKRALRADVEHANGRLVALVAELETMLERSGAVASQTRLRLSGAMPNSATRLVSLHDPDARPIKKGRLGKPVEFGHKLNVVDNRDGVVVDHSVHQGAAPDAPMLAPAIARVTALVGKAPHTVTADRGYGEKAVEDELTGLGVKNVVIPRKGKTSAARRAHEHRRSFQRLVKWRTGSEGRIATLKRQFCLDRTLFDGLSGATCFIGLGVLAHNLVKISALLDTAGGIVPPAHAAKTTTSRSSARPPDQSRPPGRDGPQSTG